MEWLRRGRSVLSLLVTLAMFPLGMLPFYVWYVPRARLGFGTPLQLASAFMKRISVALLWGLRLGGARFERQGVVPTGEPVLIVANHQSLIDILTVNLLAVPLVPAFVTRARYARFIPLVSACIRMIGCPIVDPRKNPEGAVEAIRIATRELRHGLLIFPEGHRTRDGEVRPFRTRGLESMLAERRLPVYLVASDGLWRARRLIDFAFNVHRLRGRAEVMGPFVPPEEARDHAAFIEGLRNKLVERIARMRAQERDA